MLGSVDRYLWWASKSSSSPKAAAPLPSQVRMPGNNPPPSQADAGDDALLKHQVDRHAAEVQSPRDFQHGYSGAGRICQPARACLCLFCHWRQPTLSASVPDARATAQLIVRGFDRSRPSPTTSASWVFAALRSNSDGRPSISSSAMYLAACSSTISAARRRTPDGAFGSTMIFNSVVTAAPKASRSRAIACRDTEQRAFWHAAWKSGLLSHRRSVLGLIPTARAASSTVR